MQLTSPIEAVAAALHHAALVALPDVKYPSRDHAAMRGWSAEQRNAAMRDGTEPQRLVTRRPQPNECEVFAMFTQTWGSTALGFGGIGGAAMTPAYTVVIQGPGGNFAVYIGSRFAYLVDPNKPGQEHLGAQFMEDVKNRRLAGAIEAAARYSVMLPGLE